LTVPNSKATDLAGAIALHQDYAKTKRAKLDYEIDGLVVRAHDVHVQHMLGELGNRPRAAVAFKFASQIGRLLSELALDGKATIDLTAFALDRPILKMKNPPKNYMQ